MGAGAGGEGHGEGSGGGRLVLIVEDNEKNLKLVRDLLEFRGFRTIEATSGAEGLRLAAAERPSLVLMDVQLPDMDGVEALDRLRREPATARTPVVAVTAFAMKGDRERLLSAGFDAYVAKPIDVRSFVDDLLPLLR